MAKFKPGDKVTWQHHNGSYSNEVIDYIVPPNGYAFRDGGIGAESEIRAGWVPESQTGRANMPPLNSRACNGVRSRNASAKIVTTGNFGTLKVGDRVDFRKSRYWRGTGVVTKVYGDGIIDVKGDNGEGEMEIHEEDIMNSRVRSRNAVVAKALNACGTARNATDADVARYLSAAKDRIRGEVVTLKDVVGLLKMNPMPPSAEKAHEKIVKAMASLQRAFAELS